MSVCTSLDSGYLANDRIHFSAKRWIMKFLHQSINCVCVTANIVVRCHRRRVRSRMGNIWNNFAVRWIWNQTSYTGIFEFTLHNIDFFYFEWSGQRPMDPFDRKQTNCNSKPVENMGNWCLGGDCSLSPKNTQRNRSCYWPGLIEQKIIFILGPRIGVKKGMRIMTFLL